MSEVRLDESMEENLLFYINFVKNKKKNLFDCISNDKIGEEIYKNK